MHCPKLAQHWHAGTSVNWTNSMAMHQSSTNWEKASQLKKTALAVDWWLSAGKSGALYPKILILGPKSKTLCTTTMVCQYGNFFVSTVLHRRLLGGRRGQFWAQNTRILSLRSQFWTSFWANWPGFIDVSGYAFGAILANWRHIFQRVVLIILLSLLLYCAFLDQFKFFHFICFIFQISFQISKQNWP